jgi:hypothetical protein
MNQMGVSLFFYSEEREREVAMKLIYDDHIIRVQL